MFFYVLSELKIKNKGGDILVIYNMY